MNLSRKGVWAKEMQKSKFMRVLLKKDHPKIPLHL